MEKENNEIYFIGSRHTLAKVAVTGFDVVDDSIHMLEWMRKGRNIRQFVVDDIEAELYSQDAKSQLLSVHCKAKPKFETKVKSDVHAQRGVVTQIVAVFPISLRVRAANGAIWLLDIEHTYQATSLDVPDKVQLRLNFTIVGHHIDA